MGADRYIEKEWELSDALRHLRALTDERNLYRFERDRHQARADAYMEWILEKAKHITDCSCRYTNQSDGTAQRCPTHRILAEHGDLPPDLDPREKER